jgi:hypothetical protein
MGAGNLSHEEVCAIEDKLEISPSCKQGGSPYGGKKSGGAIRHAAGKAHAGSESTSELHTAGVPGFGGARTAKRTTK